MTREAIAQKIRWPLIIWCVSIINPLTILPQLYTLWHTGETAGLSLEFLGIMLLVQAGFSLHGFFSRDNFIMGSNGIAAAMNLLTIFSALYFRHLA